MRCALYEQKNLQKYASIFFLLIDLCVRRQQHAAQAAPAAPAPKRPAPGPEYSYVEDEAPSTAPQSDAALQEQLARTLKVQWDVSISDYTCVQRRTNLAA